MHNPPTKTEQRWVLFLTGSLLLSLLAFAWITRKPLCFESEAVRVLRWGLGPNTGSESQDVFRCRVRKHIDYRDDLAQELPSLSGRLQLLDAFGEFYLPELWSKARVRLRIEENDHQARDEADAPTELVDVIVYEDELELPGLLESRILSSVIDTGLAVKNIPKSPSVQMLKTYLGSLAGYDDEKADLGDWKLSLYSEAIKRARQGLAVSTQKQVFLTWKNLILTGEAKSWEIPNELVSPMHESLALFGYRQNKKIFQVPFAVYFADPSIVLNTDEKKRLHRQLAAVIYRNRALFPFSNREYLRAELEPIQVGRLVLFQCGVPKMEELDFMGIEFEHLLFVQSCARPDLDMVVSALRNPKLFASSFPDVDFVQLHLPSLRLAFAKSGLETREIVSLLSPASQSSLRKLGLLTEITKDEVSSVQSWKGAIEPLPLFRLQGVFSPR